MKEKESTIIHVRLQPGASKDEISGWMDDGALKIRVRSKPIEGKANENLIKYLSKLFSIPKKDVEITTGLKSRSKLVKIRGMAEKDIKKTIDQMIS